MSDETTLPEEDSPAIVESVEKGMIVIAWDATTNAHAWNSFATMAGKVRALFAEDDTTKVFAVSGDKAVDIYCDLSTVGDHAEEKSALVDHAIRELTIVGEEAEMIDWYVNVIRAFNKYGHSGGSASVAIPVLNMLLQFKNLSPLTENPLEWMYVGDSSLDGAEGVWQSLRNPEAFSHDGGRKIGRAHV